jgi:predicted metal-dependent enzyme (double-stranded beta helix superfamily)
MIQALAYSPVLTYRPKTRPESGLASLIYHLERAVGNEDPTSTANNVREALMNAIATYGSFIPDRFLRPTTHGYARRRIYIGADNRFSLLAMVWAPGQCTPLHDHGGAWCVECVYRGEVQGRTYAHEAVRDGVHYFRETGVARECEGQSSALVPPFDHHILENRSDSVAVTLHVYPNELLACNAYMPRDGGGCICNACTLGYCD